MGNLKNELKNCFYFSYSSNPLFNRGTVTKIKTFTWLQMYSNHQLFISFLSKISIERTRTKIFSEQKINGSNVSFLKVLF